MKMAALAKFLRRCTLSAAAFAVAARQVCRPQFSDGVIISGYQRQHYVLTTVTEMMGLGLLVCFLSGQPAVAEHHSDVPQI